MTGYVAFWSSVDSGDGDVITSVISTWVGVEGRSKSRSTGIETTWEAGDVEVYAHPGLDASNDPSMYLIEGRLPGPVNVAKAKLIDLLNALNNKGGRADIDYQERDENDDDVGGLETLG